MEVGICGTFDVANYGDLLFPLIAEAELSDRLGAVRLHRFSYHAKTTPHWPYEVSSIDALPRMMPRLDALLIGGGHLIRFDKSIAEGYGPPTPEIHHPTGYWLVPALIALEHGVPVVWNAPSAGSDIPKWAHPLMETVLTLSRYVSVRGEASRARIEQFANSPVSVVPDSAFGLGRLVDLSATPSAEFTQLCDAAGLDSPYIVIQAVEGLEEFVCFVKKHLEALRNFQFLVLPIGPVLGDRPENIDADSPPFVHLPTWPGPLAIAEIIGRSEAVVGLSFHLTVTALVSGVPAFRPSNRLEGKYFPLQRFETIFELPPFGEPDLDWFVSRVGRTTPSATVSATSQLLADHWDRVVSTIRAEPETTPLRLNRLLQSLPGLLEDAAADLEKERAEKSELLRETASLRNRLDEAVAQLAASRAETAARDAHLADIFASTSWRVTAPVRFAGRPFARPKRTMIDLERIRWFRLETDPYQWAAIADLIHAREAEKLVSTYPRDHFKLVAAYAGERTYDYEARSLIRMGANAISFPGDLSDAWRALASDLLSPEYRAAMTALTGQDLSSAPMEVNVFHYGPSSFLDAHRDLPEKLATHVLYFNRSWKKSDGGCLRILRSADTEDIAAEISPVVGNSALIVRSESSWHCVSTVVANAACSRRSVTITFYRPGSVSTMWPPGDTASLHRYAGPSPA